MDRRTNTDAAASFFWHDHDSTTVAAESQIVAMEEAPEHHQTQTQTQTQKPRVMMLPSVGRGHIIPCVRLAQKLVPRGVAADIVVTPRHIKFLQHLLHEVDADAEIRALELPLPATDETQVPESGSFNNNSVALHQMPLSFGANELLEEPFRRFLAEHLASNPAPPLCLISDFLLGWTSAVAAERGIPRVCLDTCGMFAESLSQLLWDRLPRTMARSPSGRLIVPGLPRDVRLTPRQMHPELPSATTETGRHVFFKRQRAGNRLSCLTLANTFYDLEAQFVDHFERVNGPLRCIGPLLPDELFEEKQRRGGGDGERCMEWLDAQPDASVVYVSFGSENSVSARQMAALAEGLESSGVRFLWVVRRPADADGDGDAGEGHGAYLPGGFVQRVAERGLGFVVEGWAPQLRVLGHPATGGFVSHCGWNAVLESLACGVPMVAWPLSAEQPFNSKFVVEELRTALEAPQRVDDGWFVHPDDVADVVRRVIGGAEASVLRESVLRLRAALAAAVAPGGSSHRNLDAFAQELIRGSLGHGKS